MSIKEDFLRADQPIPGQNFVCLSFVSPENVLKDKNHYFLSNFLKSLVKDLPEEVQQKISELDITDKYKDYLVTNEERLQKEFYEANDFRTSVRGLKVRGVFDTQREAEMHAKKLRAQDESFNVYVGQVGFWLPWDPSPDSISKQEYAEQELNELVKQYKENQEARKEVFNDEVNEKIKEAEERVKQLKKMQKTIKDDESGEQGGEQGGEQQKSSLESNPNVMESEDPWVKKKQ